jgi:hypothetical protein
VGQQHHDNVRIDDVGPQFALRLRASDQRLDLLDRFVFVGRGRKSRS